jgi:hypothetical protein
MLPLFTRSGSIFGSSPWSRSEAVSRDRQPIDLYPRIGDERWSDQALTIAMWSFVGFGVLIRLVRYFLVHPLWSDESFVAVNLLDRGYLGLLQPLDYQQVCPVLFLWVELTAVKLLGFSEWSLRLLPMLCGIGSLFAFGHLASRLMQGLPLLMALAIVAVAINPIRHSGEVKPYACDFLVSTVLLALVVEWWRRPERSTWLWTLAGLTPLAMGFSLPSAFVIGGISLAISTSVSLAKRPRVTAAYLAFNLAIVLGSLASLSFYGGARTVATRDYMLHYWSSHFPPWDEPLRLPLWLLCAGTGQLFAYPIGGANGGSLLTLACVAVGGSELIRRGRGVLVAAMLAPLALALIASMFWLYPFGETERLMQFAGPMICLLAGYGLAWCLGQARRPRSYRRRVAACLGLFAAIGLGTIISDFARPAKTVQDLQAREFARKFWGDLARDSELACARVDLGLDFEGGSPPHGRSADYRCLQKIYSERHRQGRPIDWSSLSPKHPLKCVIYDGVPVDSPLFARWMELMSLDYLLDRTETYRVNAGFAPTGVPYEDHLAVLVFVPKGNPVDPVAIARAAASTEFRPKRGTLSLSTLLPSLLP